MDKTPLETIDELLETAIDELDDTDVQYKLRSAQQLLKVVQQRHDELDAVGEDAISDEAVLDNLRDLGYLD